MGGQQKAPGIVHGDVVPNTWKTWFACCTYRTKSVLHQPKVICERWWLSFCLSHSEWLTGIRAHKLSALRQRDRHHLHLTTPTKKNHQAQMALPVPVVLTAGWLGGATGREDVKSNDITGWLGETLAAEIWPMLLFGTWASPAPSVDHVIFVCPSSQITVKFNK